ncbi:DUF4296 domain-containing protein [Dysgonomonas sp. ZJ279]|uniref:DUF4296 domain-containing protein n=1 Tax=Dysgonomonas sp. ZJ279 TaxID=2709796 RepID=UPI0013EA99C5|nr:DUF4296 domain-containing protein [Dysgonomonas sp. ZJ279]
MPKNTFICTVLICLTVVASCSRKPSNVLDEEKMVDVLYDVQMAQAIYNSYDQNLNTLEKKDALIAGVLEKHNITKADLDSSLVWYSDNIKLYLNINDSVVSRLKSKTELLSKARDLADPNLNGKRDLILPSLFYLNAINSTLSFNVDSAKIKTMDLSSFRVSFDVLGLNKNQTVKAGIYFTYRDTIIKKIIPIDQNIHYVLDKPQLPDSLLKSISGYIHLRKPKDSFLSDIMLYNIRYQDSIPATTDTQLDIITPGGKGTKVIEDNRKVTSQMPKEN